MAKSKLPVRMQNLMKYLENAKERANEDFALQYFRETFEGFTRQEEAERSDGYVPGLFVLEFKGTEGDSGAIRDARLSSSRRGFAIKVRHG